MGIRHYPGARLKKRGLPPFLWFLLPATVLVGGVLIFPILYAIVISFYNWPLIDTGQPRPFIGLKNYFDLFKDADFWKSFRLQMGFILIALPIELVIGFFVAILLNRKFPGARLIRALLLLPVFILPVLSGLTWRLMLQPKYGLFTYLFSLMGIKAPVFLADANYAYAAVIVQDIWRMWPFMFMILYAGLTGIPQELFEAADLDGASFWQRISNITIPLLKSTITTALLLRVIDALRIFSEVMTMTEGGPGDATRMLSIYIYQQAFKYQNVGLAASMAIILVIVSIAIAIALVRKNLEAEPT